MEKKRRRKVIPFLTLALIFAFILSITAFAYVTMTFGYYQRVVPVKTTNTTYPISEAIDSWNSVMPSTGTQKRVTNLVSIVHNSNNFIYVTYKTDSWYGQYSATTVNNNSNNRATEFSITINTRTIGSSDEFRQSTIAHEIGHAYGLDDDNNTGNLMDQNRDRETVYVPQSSDISGAKVQAFLLP